MMKRTSNGGKPWENLGKMLGIRGGFAGENHGETGWIFHDKTI